MEKNYKILIAIGIVLVVVVVGVVFQVDKTNKTLAYNKQQEITQAKMQLDYENAIASIKDGNIPDIAKSFQNLNDYKDSDMILQYLWALEESKKDKPGYSWINRNLDRIPLDYKGDMAKEISDLRIQVKNDQDALVKQKEIAEQQKIVDFIKTGDYDQAESYAVSKFPILYSYANALEAEKVGLHDNALIYWVEIPSNYSGPLSSEMLKYINAHSEEIQSVKDVLASSQKQQSKPKPRIGMTSSEVSNSQWGSPTKVNRTTTANSVSEQWVYGSGRYVYLEDGIVTSIQD